MVFTNMEYRITFYDANTGRLRALTGLVTDVREDQIKIKSISSNQSTKNCATCAQKYICDKYKDTTYGTSDPMPNCHCILNPPDISKYSEPEICFIPVQNIVNVEYVVGQSNTQTSNKKGGTKVMLLGICATAVKAIIVHLEFIDDSIDDAIKFVDLQVGGIYNIAYEVKGNGCQPTVYESIAKIVSIDEVSDYTIQSDRGFVREYVGVNNSVYTHCACTDKDKFMNGGPAKHIKLTVDTSENFSGRYECIMLDAIRDCTLLQTPDGNPAPDDGDGCGCNPKPPCGCLPQNSFVFKDGSTLVMNPDGTVVITNSGGCSTNTKLTDIFKFYLGLE